MWKNLGLIQLTARGQARPGGGGGTLSLSTTPAPGAAPLPLAVLLTCGDAQVWLSSMSAGRSTLSPCTHPHPEAARSPLTPTQAQVSLQIPSHPSASIVPRPLRAQPAPSVWPWSRARKDATRGPLRIRIAFTAGINLVPLCEDILPILGQPIPLLVPQTPRQHWGCSGTTPPGPGEQGFYILWLISSANNSRQREEKKELAQKLPLYKQRIWKEES